MGAKEALNNALYYIKYMSENEYLVRENGEIEETIKVLESLLKLSEVK